MSLHHYNYIIKENPPASRGDGSEESLGYHVRLKPSPTVSQEQLVRVMHKLEPVLSRGVIISAIGTLARALSELLADGHTVNVEEIGTFQPRLSGTVKRERRGLVAREVHISGVQFTPDPELLLQLRTSSSSPSASSRPLPSDATVEAFLVEHFTAHDRLTRKDVITHFHVTKDQALRLLRRLVAQGHLRLCGSRATAYYVR